MERGKVQKVLWSAMMQARRAVPALSSRVLVRRLAGTKSSPSAQQAPAAAAATPLSKEEEQRQRAKMVADVMREKTMRQVSEAAAARRPEGVKHMLDIEPDPADDAAPQYAAKYDEDADEWGGPKGDEPTRYGDWERQGKAIDF